LMFNTNMQQASFKATALQDRVNVLTAKEQSLDMELDQLRDPQSLAVAAKHLGMVAPSQPAFIRLGDGQVLGRPTPAIPADAVRVTPQPAKLPASMKPKTIIVRIKPDPLATSLTDTRGASTTSTSESGRKKASTSTSTSADSGASH
jgi:hypothetical protein